MTPPSKNPARFLPTMFSVCSGTDGFPALLRQSLWRATGHFFILGLLCIAANLLLRAAPLHTRLAKTAATIEARFGPILLEDGSLRPARNHDQARTLSLDPLRIDYFPDAAAAQAFSPATPCHEQIGLLWTPTALLLWQRFDERRCYVVPFPATLLFPELTMLPTLPTLVEHAAVSGCLEQARFTVASSSGATPSRRSITAMVFPGWILMMLMVVLEGMFKAYLIAPCYIFMFCLIMHVFRPQGVPSPGLPELLKLGNYAAFPALIIAMLASALELPYFDFPMVFSIAFLLWLFIVYGRLRRLTQRTETDEENFE